MKLSSVASLVNRQGESGWMASGLGTFGNFVLLGPGVVELGRMGYWMGRRKSLGPLEICGFWCGGPAGVSGRGVLGGGGIGFEIVMGVFLSSWHIVARALH
jgi:hypothetical protein